MSETPEQRNAEMREQSKLDRQLTNAEAEELRKQPALVRILVHHRNLLAGWVGPAGILDLFADVEELPATKEARERVSAAVQNYIDALGVEIHAAWVAMEEEGP